MRLQTSSLIGLFCLIGCLYQIFDITKSYLQFKVRHDVAYDYSTYVELPAIDIIVPMGIAINYTKMIAKYPLVKISCNELKKKFGSSNYSMDYIYKKCAETYTLIYLESNPIVSSQNFSLHVRVEHIRSFTVDLRKKVLEIFVKSFGTLNDQHCKFTRYYNGVAIFMRISCLNGTTPFSVNTNFVSLNKGVISHLKHSFGPYFGIRFSDQNDLPVYDPSKYFMIASKLGSFPVVKISYVKTVMSSLEYPYEANCRHYNKDESISKCMTEYSLRQSTPYLYKTSIYEWNEYPEHLGFKGDSEDSPHNDEKIKDQDDEHHALINCGQQSTATECEKTDYLVEGKTSNEAEGDYGMIYIEHNWKANIYSSVHPILPWRKFLIFVGSILGIWFGKSIHDYMPKTLSYITIIFLRLLHTLSSFKFPVFVLPTYPDP